MTTCTSLPWDNARPIDFHNEAALAMIQQLLFALALSAVTVIIHAVGTVRFMLPMCGIWKERPAPKVLASPVAALIRLVSGLLVLHLAAMAVWALAYRLFGVLPDFETCFYYSLMSYPTIGYGDVGPETAWRLLGPIEGTVGVLMLGLSTGIIVSVVQRLYANRLPTSDARRPSDDR